MVDVTLKDNDQEIRDGDTEALVANLRIQLDIGSMKKEEGGPDHWLWK